jgi:putative transposase
MRCVECGSDAVGERPERTAQGYRRLRCRACGKPWNERSGTVLNRAQYLSDVIALVVLWRLRCKLSLRDWEAKLTPARAEELRHRCRGKAGCS